MSSDPHDNQNAAPQTSNTGDPHAESAEAAPSPETLKAALKAFKKRLKLTQLDDNSRIGRSPMSGGQTNTIAGITPPNQYPRRVWEELVKQGKLKPDSHGMYRLP